MDIVITLIFSVAMLVFMAFPAMKIVNFLETKFTMSEKTSNILQVVITILLSVIIGLFLKFA
jgi:hypothetical protein